MPGPWLSWTRTLSCKSDSKDVVVSDRKQSKFPHSSSTSKIQPAPVLNPVAFLQGGNRSSSGGGNNAGIKQSSFRSSCNCSLANLKDVVHGNTRVMHRASSSGSPRSNKDSADFLHEVSQDALFLEGESHSPTQEAPLIIKASGARKKFSCNGCTVLETMDSMVSYKDSAAMLARNCNFPQLSCQKCGDCFSRIDALEHHHTVQHAVSELGRGDSSRNIIEIIFRSSWISSNTTPSSSIGRIERVLKVHNSQRTIARFEDYRDMVKCRANCLAKKNARCIADGNELLRFFGSTVACPLGAHGSTSICSLNHCSICKIIRCGFKNSSRGICTTATSSNAHSAEESYSCGNNGNISGGKRVMLVCRVIAGRSYRSSSGGGGVADIPGAAPNGYDSVVTGIGSDGGNLVVFNPRAVLPCFVVIYKC